MEERTVLHALRAAVERHPGKVALEDGERVLTYAELERAAARFAGGLAALGVGPGDPVLLMLDNHAGWVEAWLGACFRLAVEVPVNTAFRGHPLAHLAADSEARVAVVDDAYCERLAEIAADAPELGTVVVRGGRGSALPPGRFRVVPWEEVAGAPALEALPAAPGDLLGLLYTSGTTGPARAARVPHAQAFSCGAAEHIGACEPDDRMLISVPLFHVVGQWVGVLNALRAGSAVVLRPRFSAASFLDDARLFDCSSALLMAAMAGFLNRRPPSPGDRDHPLRRVLLLPFTTEGAEFCRRFGVEAWTGYGMTEVSTPLVAPLGTPVPGGCGLLRPDFEARLVGPDDAEVAPGETGELLLRPRDPWSVMLGYHHDPERTAEMWRNLWIHTGDLMRKDPSGHFHFVDRRRDAIRRRGENVSSFEVEAAALSHPDVAECAAVGVPGEGGEDDVLAALVLRPGTEPDPMGVIRHLAGRLPYFMVPRYLRFLAELPKTPTERVRKFELRELGSAGAWDREAAGLRVGREGVTGAAAEPAS